MNNPSPPAALQIFGGDEQEATRANRKHIAYLTLSTIASLAILWFATKNMVLVGSCAGAMVGVWGLVDYVRRTRPQQEASQMLPPDW